MARHRGVRAAHVAIVVDQNSVRGQGRVQDGFRGWLLRCSVMVGLWPAGSITDGAEDLQLLLKGPLEGRHIRRPTWR